MDCPLRTVMFTFPRLDQLPNLMMMMVMMMVMMMMVMVMMMVM